MSYFSPDVRNIGGRKVIANIMSNHFTHMVEMRPTLSCRATSGYQVPQRGLSSTLHSDSFSQSFQEVNFIYDKLKHLPGSSVDFLEPESMKFTSKLSKHKKLKLRSTLQGHRKNIENMQRRICEYSSVTHK